jgi:hypothetical protein
MDESTAEHERLRQADDGTQEWRGWGPYVSERAWGTVREDYSEHGDAWDYFPHDHARSRAYRWSEDGMAGVCDAEQRFCLALALWNGEDPILKERMFGLTGPQGNHGEDVKECWWYLDATPTHSWAVWRYHYPQRAFPYDQLVHHGRGRDEPELELIDTGIFDEGRYWAVTVEYAKAGPTDLCMRITAENRGPEPASLHVLPTLWFRNTWAWGLTGQDAVPTIRVLGDGSFSAEHPGGPALIFSGDPGAMPLVCDNETNTERLWGVPGRSGYPKDGINDHVVSGAATVNPEGTGTKGALWYRLDVPAAGTATVSVRLTEGRPASAIEASDAVLARRRAEADAYHATLTPPGTSSDEALVVRQALAGMLWGKQYFHYDVARWLDGDPAGPPPPLERHQGRNSRWRHIHNADVISMPDPWEYPWYAAWDLAFHCVPLTHVDPRFAKDQLLLLLREWYMHPAGQLPAYEWSFDDVNPPVHAWAALRVFTCDGSRDLDFLARAFHKLTINFTWWVNRKDASGDNLFEGGFLGLDNIGPIDRSAALPVRGVLEQSDGTAWMAMYCLNLLEIALVLAEHDPTYEDVATKFLEHFALIATAAHEKGLWDEEDGFFYDVLSAADGRRIPMRVRSVVGLLPLCATMTLGSDTLQRLPRFAERFAWFVDHVPAARRVVGQTHLINGTEGRLLSMVGPEQLPRLLALMLDEQEFLSPHGLRSVSQRHRDAPFVLDLPELHATVDYEPGESSSGLFGGNSNWRGPVWFPVNYLLIEAVRRFARFYGDDFLVECPTGSGAKRNLYEVAASLTGRLVGTFLDDADGRRAVFGDCELLQTDPAWHNQLWFHEYFHGETGAGLGASHQTGWTGLVADCVLHQGEFSE